jgi:hypothetical protein
MQRKVRIIKWIIIILLALLLVLLFINLGDEELGTQARVFSNDIRPWSGLLH